MSTDTIVGNWTQQKIRSLSGAARFTLWKNSVKLDTPDAKWLRQAIEELDVPLIDPKTLRYSDPIAVQIYEIVNSKSGAEACLKANDRGFPALAGVEQTLISKIGPEYQGANYATVVAGVLVGDLMRSKGYLKAGEAAMPAESVAKTAAIWKKRDGKSEGNT